MTRYYRKGGYVNRPSQNTTYNGLGCIFLLVELLLVLGQIAVVIGIFLVNLITPFVIAFLEYLHDPTHLKNKT